MNTTAAPYPPLRTERFVRQLMEEEVAERLRHRPDAVHEAA
jgi:hypothetical protein